MKLIATFILTLILAGCVYTPKKVSIYDEKCEIVVNHMELEKKQILSLSKCEDESCYSSILGAGLTSAGSVIISGTIVVSANVAYWFEKQAQCK